MKLSWQPEDTPPELQAALRTLAEEYPITEGTVGDVLLNFESSGETGNSILLGEDSALIRYRKPNDALRAVGTLLAGLACKSEEEIEDSPFRTFGMMLDCSRNAVMNVASVKRWLRRLALFGYNMAMLYTEDTYEIPGEESFGYQRGRYTAGELQELDAYAASLGIQMIGCIQTLGHLEQILRWPAYRAIRNQESVLLVGEEKTYALIAKMLDATRQHFRSPRIHIGMDEAWHLGRGAYLDRFGGRPRFDILNEHLQRVVAMCRERGFQPMIWSDMYFMMGSPKHRYLDLRSAIPPEVIEHIPKDVQLVYWDYYHADKDTYLDWIRRHRELGYEPVMASGIWTWAQLWYNRELTEMNAGAAIDAAREAGVPEIFFTLWGDDGACCDFDSALAGLAWAAERAFSPTAPRPSPLAPVPEHLARRFQAICGASYEAVTKASELTGTIPFAAVLWDDPLLGIFRHHGLAGMNTTWPDLERRFATLEHDLLEYRSENAAGDLAHAHLLASALHQKIGLRTRLEAAYRKRDHAALAQVRDSIPALSRTYEALAESWRRQWLRRNKPFGLEVVQIRLAGQIARLHELSRRVDELIAGQVDCIPELDVKPPLPESEIGTTYGDLASGSVIR